MGPRLLPVPLFLLLLVLGSVVPNLEWKIAARNSLPALLGPRPLVARALVEPVAAVEHVAGQRHMGARVQMDTLTRGERLQVVIGAKVGYGKVLPVKIPPPRRVPHKRRLPD